MSNLVAGEQVTCKGLNGVYIVLALNYDGSCTLVDMDGKHTYTVHVSKIIRSIS